MGHNRVRRTSGKQSHSPLGADVGMRPVVPGDVSGDTRRTEASRAFAQEREERQATRSRHEAPRDEGAKMSEVVKYGFCDTAGTRVQSMRRDGDRSTERRSRSTSIANNTPTGWNQSRQTRDSWERVA